MTTYERMMLAGAGAIAAAYFIFALLMTDGWSLGARSAGFMGLCLLGFTVVLAASVIIGGVTAPKQSASIPDEREEILDIAAGSLAYHSLEVAVFIVILLGLLEHAMGVETLGSYSLTRSEGLVFWLVSTISFAGFVRLLGSFIMARRA